MCNKSMLERMNKVKSLQGKYNSNRKLYKLAYYEGGNLVLLRYNKFRWVVEDQTGAWFQLEYQQFKN